jgi:hypothetical protein
MTRRNAAAAMLKIFENDPEWIAFEKFDPVKAFSYPLTITRTLTIQLTITITPTLTIRVTIALSITITVPLTLNYHDDVRSMLDILMSMLPLFVSLEGECFEQTYTTRVTQKGIVPPTSHVTSIHTCTFPL